MGVPTIRLQAVILLKISCTIYYVHARGLQNGFFCFMVYVPLFSVAALLPTSVTSAACSAPKIHFITTTTEEP